MSIFAAFIASDRLESFGCGTLARESFLASLPCVVFDTSLPDGVDVCLGEIQLKDLVDKLGVLHVRQYIGHGQLLDGHLHIARLPL